MRCSRSSGRTARARFTVFNCVGGFCKPTGGDVVLDGHAIGGLPSHKIALKVPVRVPEHPPVQVADRRREPARRAAPQGEGGAAARPVLDARVSPCREGSARTRGRVARPDGADVGREPAGGHAVVRAPAAPGDRALHDHRAAPPDARRAGGRPQPAGEDRAAAPDRQAAPRVRRIGAADRTRHEPRDGRVRPHPRDGARPADRDRHAGSGPQRPARDQGVSGEE